jgi:prepilin-type N-terminal cleavage/methylation domain-containing protein
MHNRAGFTLIEISIVLVVIGLIIGGVLVGRNLIEAAAVRAQIAQIEQLKTAVNTFRTKYNAIPGDMLNTTAAAVGMTYRSGQPGHGDGNGILESCSPQNTFNAVIYFGCETALFWRDLSDAGLIAGIFTGDTDGLLGVDEGQQETFFPPAKIGNHNFLAVYGGIVTTSNNGWSYLSGDTITYTLVQDLTTVIGSGQYEFSAGGITPGEAFAIDTKMDDGMPATGMILGGTSAEIILSINNGVGYTSCAYSNDGITYYYQLSKATVDMPSCIMNFQ